MTRGRTPPALVLLVGLNFLWLFSPPPIHYEDSCGPYYPLNRYMGFMVHCDSIKFVEMARDPSMLLNPDEIQKSRPLYVVTGATLGRPIERIVDAVRPGTKPNFPYFLAFLLINVAAVSAALWLFAGTLASVGASVLMTALLAVPLLSNDVTKAFFWTAHSQMFNIFAPVLAIAAGYYVAIRPRLPLMQFLALAFTLGLFLLVYGTFLALLPVIVMAWWYAARQERFDWRRALLAPALAVTCFGLPTFVWIAITIRYAGRYFNREVIQFRQLIWILDTLQEGPGRFLSAWAHHSIAFGRTLTQPDVVLAAVLVAGVYVATRSHVRSRRDEPNQRASALEFVSLAAFACVFTFFWMLGFYEQRLTFAIVPALLCWVGVRLTRASFDDASSRIARRLAPVAAVAWVLFHVLKYGPFS